MDLELKDKVAVITGGSYGIGQAVAEGLAKEGVHVALCARNTAQLAVAAQDIQSKYGVRALWMAADVSKSADIIALVKRVEEEFGGADILINNAGIGSNEDILTAADDKWQYYWDLHVMAAVRLARGLIPGMRRRGGGVILHNASICAKQPIDYEPIYNVTKAALMMFSKTLSDQVAGQKIRVNCINPGLIQTQAWENYARKQVEGTGRSWQDRLDEIAQEYTPIGRFASPQELADFFVFLCSPRAGYCVGSTYYVDGGWLKVVA